MSHYSKSVNITIKEKYLWDIFWRINSRHRSDEGGPVVMTAQEFSYEVNVSGDLISRVEAGILLKMDAAYCSALREEIRCNTIRAREKTGT